MIRAMLIWTRRALGASPAIAAILLLAGIASALIAAFNSGA